MKHPFHLTHAAQVCVGVAWVSIVQVAAASDAEIVMVQGKVDVRDQASGLWREAVAKQGLNVGDSVRTGESGQTAILVKDKTQVRLNQRSIFRLKEAGDAEGGTSLELTSGRMWTQAKQFTVGLLRATTGLIKRQPKLAVTTPTATIGIRGTDWEVSVGDSGETLVSVFSGEVAVSNDLGEVFVGPNEQATVRSGMAPTKTVLTDARDRVQWVSAVRLDVDKYPDLAQTPQGQGLRDALATQRIQDARDATEALLDVSDKGKGSAPAGTWLMAADFGLLAGDMALVAKRLADGRNHFPADDRFPAYQARAALLRGDIAGARAWVDAARQKFPASAELALVEGELGRLEGHGDAAVASFGAASEMRPKDFRAWQGLGVTLAEQEDFAPARTALTRAVALAPQFAAPLADLGAMETRAQRLPQAQAAIDQSLALAPDDYVAWTSRGILLLTQGQPEAALQALLKAGLLEPRYAKAQIYTAIAWYQTGREDAALAALDKAKQADPNDPLPYFYEAQIQRDNLNPMAALTAAREALARFGYLKSLGPIATDRQGNANLGTAYAMFGLEAWAQRIAQQSQHPFFAGSYLFSAERTTDAFVKNSELIQGYLTDPTMFGASPQRSKLISAPGGYAALDASYIHSASLSQSEPSFIANGYLSSPMPVAGFLQYAAPRATPGQVALHGTFPSFITAVGIKPQANLGIFVYHEEFRPHFSDLKLLTSNDRLTGADSSTHVGAQWQFNPKTALWVHAGKASGQAQVVSNSQAFTRDTRDEKPEFGLRFTALRDSGEWSLVAEQGKVSQAWVQASAGRLFSVDERVVIDTASNHLVGSWKKSFGDLLAQFDLNYARFQLTREGTSMRTQMSNGRVNNVSLPTIKIDNKVFSPNVGFAWSPTSASTYRLVYQDVTRAAAAASLANQNTAGISLDVPGLDGGGRLKRLRFQGEWELAGNAFVKVFADYRKLRNLTFEEGSPLNETADTSQLRRLRQQGVASAESIESLAGKEAVPAGVVRATGVVVEGIAGATWGWSAAYLNHQTRNEFFPGLPLPDYPEHIVRLGANWFAPNRWVLRTALTRRSERTTNFTGATWLAADWDLSFSAAWQDAAKRHSFEVFTSGHFRKIDPPIYGVRGVWRF